MYVKEILEPYHNPQHYHTGQVSHLATHIAAHVSMGQHGDSNDTFEYSSPFSKDDTWLAKLEEASETIKESAKEHALRESNDFVKQK